MRGPSECVAVSTRVAGICHDHVSVALAGGFVVLGASNFVPIAHFGVLSAAVMLVAMASELTLTPILMYWAAQWHGTWSPFAGLRRSGDAASAPPPATPHPPLETHGRT